VPLSLTVNGSSVLGLPSLSVVPVRRQTYTLSGSNLLNSTPSTMTKTLAARGLDLVAGSIAGAGASDNANPTQAQLNAPRQIAADAAGNLYIADSSNHTIRMAAVGGGVTTLVGSPGLPGSLDGAGSSALFNNPRGIAVTPDGSTVYVYDATNKAIRKLTKSAGTWTSSTCTSSLGAAGYGQIKLDPTGSFLVIADSGASVIRVLRRSDNQLVTYAGNGGYASRIDLTTPGVLTTATFDSPEGIAFNKAGTYFYVSDAYSTANDLRMVQWTAPPTSGAMTIANGTVFTLAGPAWSTAKGYRDGTGSSALFGTLASMDVDGNDVLYLSDLTNSVIRTVTGVTPAQGGCTVGTIAGTVPGGTPTAPVPVTGSTDGPLLSAKFNGPNGVLCVGTKVYVSDTNNSAIRVFDTTNVSTPVGVARQTGTTDATGTAARFNAPQGVAAFGGTAYVADTTNNSLRKVALLDGATTTLATGFTQIKGVAVDNTGRVYVTDNGTAPAKAVIQVAADGTKTTIVQGLSAPQNLAVSPLNPNLLYVVDNNAILEVTVVRNGDSSFASASITNTIGVAATAGYVDSPAPGTARFKIGSYFAGLAVDGSGNILVADEGNSCIRKITAGTYAVTTIAGIGAPQIPPATNNGFIDGALGTNKFYFPNGLVVDPSGIIYVADQSNHAIRKIPTNGTVSTVLGQYTTTNAPNGAPVLYGAAIGAIPNTNGDISTGGASTNGAALYKPYGLAITAAGDLLVVTNDGIMQVTAP